MLLLASASPTFAETTIPTTNINSGNDLDVDECSFGNAAIGLELDADDAGPGHGGTTVGGDASWGYVKDCFLRDNTRGIKTSHGSAGYLMSGGASWFRDKGDDELEGFC
jgi:hypothetical protein